MGPAEMMTLIAGFIGSAFALVRLSFNGHRAMAERFVSYLEQSLSRHESVNDGFRKAIEELTTNVRENSVMLSRLYAGRVKE